MVEKIKNLFVVTLDDDAKAFKVAYQKFLHEHF